MFLDRRPGDAGRAGPFMAIVPRERLETFLSLKDIPDRSVFWNAPCGVDEFHRHRGSLTMVRIPSASGGSPRTRMVVFRHFDPKIVVLTLPVMTPSQRAWMFGPAQSLAISVPEGVLEATRCMDLARNRRQGR